MGNFMYTYLNSTSIAAPVTVPEPLPTVLPIVNEARNEPEEKIVKVTERIVMEPPSAGEIAAQLTAEQLEQIGANVLLKNEPEFKEELNRMREDLYKFQAFNAHHVARLRHEMGRCCQKPVINIEHQILDLLNDPSFLNKQKGFNDYLRGLFVAKNDLEDVLANLTVKLKGDYNDLIYSNSKMLMNEVAMKLKQQTSSGKYELPSDEHIHRVVRDVLAVYDADRTGLVDYALESMGGQVLTTRCTESYHSGKAVVSVLGIPLWYPVNSPRTVITPDLSPGQCWAFQNFPGFLVVKLSHFVKIEAFSVEHVSKLLVPNGKIDSAPKEFEVYGLLDENDKDAVLLGRYTYDSDGEPLQYFAVQNAEQIYGVVELRILSNHGNPNYTCLYRFRVHGQTS